MNGRVPLLNITVGRLLAHVMLLLLVTPILIWNVYNARKEMR